MFQNMNQGGDMQRSHKTSFKYRITAGMSLGLLLFGSIVYADTLMVQPEQLSLSASKPLTKLEFRNSSAEETTLKFDVVQWQQRDDREWLTPTRKLIVVPEKIKLRPGESGTVRVGLRLSGSWWNEEAFRVMVTQRGRIPDLGDESVHSSASRISRSLSVPVFLLPPGKANPRLSWTFERNSEGGVILRARNNGQGHARVLSASLLGPGGQSIERRIMSDILLPGGARSWEFAAGAAAGLWRLDADTNVGLMQVEFNLAPDDSAARSLSLNP
jgi:P pilus assembly chaperone PapD